jgi:hypothetical protein
MKTELLTEITKFRLYSNYNTKNTLSENYNVIQEGLVQELKNLTTNTQVKRTITSIVDNLIKKGDEFFTKKNFLNRSAKKPTTGTDVVNSIDKLDKASLDKLKVAIINNLDETSIKQINNMIVDAGFIKKYSRMTREEAKNVLKSKGYDDDAIELIISRFNKFKDVVDKKMINTSIKNLEKTYPNLFQTKWFGTSYVNSGRIENIKSELIRDFKGKDAKGIENIINNKLMQAAKELDQNKSITTQKKGFFKKLIADYLKYLKKKPAIGTLKTAGSVPTIAVAVYVLYDFIKNWHDTGNPVVALAGTGADLWKNLKQGFNFTHFYDDNPDEFLKYLNNNFGNLNWVENFQLNRNNDIISVREIASGDTRYFKYNGRTFVEIPK